MNSAPPHIRLVTKRSRGVYLKDNDLKDDAPVPKQERASGNGGQDTIAIESEQPGVKRTKGRA